MPDTIDAGTASDAEVAAALGVEEVDDEQQGTEDEGQEPEEISFEDLPKKTQDEIRSQRRELAALRIKLRELQKGSEKKTEATDDVEAARVAGREEARAEFGVQLTTEAVRAALTGVIPDDDLDEFVDELNISRFVTDDNQPDRDAIASLKARQVKLTGARRNARVSHGRSGSGTGSKSVQQLGEEALGKLLNPTH